ncbi:MAG: leucine-rich repeat protein [Clostridia bacterium]|nr:leucine-rich repeat protein [Clostridia bacterium]
MKTKVKKWLVSAAALCLTGTMGATIAFAEPFKSKTQTAGSKASWSGNAQIKDITDQLNKEALYSTEFFNTDLIKTAETLNVRPNGKSRIIVELEEASLLDKYLSEKSIQTNYEDFTAYVNANAGKTYAAMLGKDQSAFMKELDKKAFDYEIRHTYTSIINAVSLEVERDDVAAIERLTGVKSVIYSEAYAAPQVEATENVVDVYDTGIYKAEGIDYKGDGLLIAVLDTGFDKSHSAFATMPTETKVTKEDVERVLSSTEAFTYGDTEISIDDVYYNAKVPFAYDYANKDTDVFPTTVGSHGIHVAGIIAGSDDSVTGEDAEAFENGEKFLGVAPNAQLFIGKVFPDSGYGESQGAETDDLLAALSDCVTVGADVINMSLGSSSGYSRERDEDAVNAVYDSIYAAGINLVCAASNDYSSGMNGTYGSTNLTTNPDSGTVGSPSTYVNALSVASISGVKTSYMQLDTGAAVYFNESSNASGQKGDFVAELLNGATEKTFNYVVVPGYGNTTNYNQNVKAELQKGNCIAVVSRGDISFEDKQKYAFNNGAIACIIYNNLSGMISASLGTGKKIPTCTVSAEIGQLFKNKTTGTLTLNKDFKAGPFMSDFSSWGPTGDLKIKPEITAHGGEITSAVVGGYSIFSGTSMASPNMAGAVALLRQYVSENYHLTGVELANRVNQLLMSTATIVYDQNGLPYFVRKQGAGLGDIGKAIGSEAYIHVENSSKTKLELGDDPEKTGVYTMSFKISNVSSAAKTYTMDVLAMTESVSIDNLTVAEKAHMLDQVQKSFRVNGKASGKTVTVPAGEEVTVSVTLTLSAEEKKYLDENFKNGMYVEGFVTLDNTDANGVDMSIPYLAFYGAWNDAPIFDKSTYEVSEDYYDSSLKPEEKTVAAVYESVAYGRYYRDYEDYYMPLGQYIYLTENDADSGVVSTVDKISIGNSTYGIYGFYAMVLGMLRGANEMTVKVQNSVTGDVIYEATEYNVRKSYLARGSFLEMELDPYELGLQNNTKYDILLEAVTAYDNGEEHREAREFSFYVDYEVPTIRESVVRYEYDEDDVRHAYLDLTLYDNHYVQSMQVFAMPTEDEPDYMTDYPIPVTTSTVRGGNAKMTLEITDWLEVFENNYGENKGKIGIRLDDFALNAVAWVIDIPDPVVDTVGANFTYDGTDGEVTASLADAKLVLQPGKYVDLADEKNVTVKLADGSNVTADLSLDMYTYATYTCSHTDAHGKNCGYTYIEKNGLRYLKGDYYYDATSGKVLQKTAHDPENAPTYPALTRFTDIIAEPIVNNQTPKSKNFVCPGCGTEVTFDYNRRTGKLTVKTFAKVTQDAMVEDVVWTTANANVAMIQDGRIYAVGVGTTTLTAKAGTPEQPYTFSFDVTVEGDAVVTYIEGLTVGCYEDKLTGEKRYSSTGYASVECGSYLRLYPLFKPWYIKGVSDLEWITSDPETVEIVATSEPDAEEPWADVLCKKPGAVRIIPKSDAEGVNGSFVLYIGEEYRLLANMYFSEYHGAGYSETYVENGETRKMLVIPANLGIYYMGYYDSTREGPFFENKDLDTVVVPEGVTSIGTQVFTDSSVRRLFLPSTIETIAAGAFRGCTQLEEVYWYDASEHSKSSIAYNADKNTYNWEAFNSGITYNAEKGAYDWSNFIVAESEKCTAKNIVVGMLGFAQCEKLSVFDFTKTTALYMGAFLDTYALTKADLTKLRYSGAEVFKNSKALENTEYQGKGMKEVTLSANTVLGADMFSGTGIEKVDFYGEYVRAGAFRNAIKLEEIVFHNDLAYIGNAAFYGAVSLETVTFNGSCGAIGDNAFEGCSAFTEFTIPEGLTSIGSGAFMNCQSLITLYVHPESNIQEVGVEVFTGCSSFAKATILGNQTSANYATVTNDGGAHVMLTDKLGAKIIIVPTTYVLDSDDGVFTVPEAITEIGKEAYANNVSLNNKELVIPEGVTTIGRAAFRGTGITKVVIPSTVTAIEAYAFANCENLKEIVFLCDLKTIPFGMFYGCSALTAIDLPESVSLIDTYAFAMTGLESLEINKGVQLIGEYTFAACENLTELTFEANSDLYYLGTGAFLGCTLLEEVLLPDSVLYIGARAFYACTAMETLYISAGVQSMGDYAFAATPALKNVTIGDGALEIGNFAFFIPGDNEGDVAPQSAMKSIVIPESVKYIGAYAFCGNSVMKTIVLPGVEYIGIGAFLACTALTDVVLGENVWYIEQSAFYASAVKNINLDAVQYFGAESFAMTNVIVDKDHTLESAIVIADAAFYGCPNVTELVLTDIEYIYSSAFMTPISSTGEIGTGSITKITFGDKLVGIGSAAFFNAKITEVHLPASLKMFGAPAFAGCMLLETITVDENNETYFVSNKALYKKLANGGYELVSVPNAIVMDKVAETYEGLEPYKILEGTVRIAPYAMAYCMDIHAVEIPASVKTIGSFGFYYMGLNILTDNNDAIEADPYERKYNPKYIFKGLEAPLLEAEYVDMGDSIASVTDLYAMFSYPAGYILADMLIPVNATGFEGYVYSLSFNKSAYSEELIEEGTQAIKDWLASLSVDALKLEDGTQVDRMEIAYSMLKSGQKSFFTSDETAKLSAAVSKIAALRAAEPTDPVEPGNPTDPSDPTDPEPTEKDGGKGWIVGVVIGAVVLVGAAAGVVVFLTLRKKKAAGEKETVAVETTETAETSEVSDESEGKGE